MNLQNRINKRSRVRGFTMLELLFVVSIIAVLAAIAVPNFLESQTRTKLARARTDMASTELALNRYYIDQGAYPPNLPEVRRYLDAALQNSIMDSSHTSAPADAKIPWWKSQTRPLENMGGMMYMNYQSDASDMPPLDFNSVTLSRLSTPVAYLGTHVPEDVFNRSLRPNYTGKFFSYINVTELFANDKATTYPGLAGDHLTSETLYYLACTGPDGELNMWHPLNGPWINYDATNGTVSPGDLFHFEGRKPRGDGARNDLRPQ